MQITSEENIKIKETVLNIEDALKNNTNVSIRIEAAHAGVMNGNYLFYLPKALTYGAASLNKFYKPLQKKHYSKTLGYIYESKYLETKVDSKYYSDIINSKNKEDLVSNVKKYIKTKEYEQNKTGFGVLVSKAKLHDPNKILDLQCNDAGTVSVAGDASEAYCSICTNYIAECGHKLGYRYKNNELCFGIIADDFEVDHISFETIPANWETNSLIIADSQLLGTIELIEEGQLMKLSLVELKEKLGNIESVFTELNILEFVEQYKTESASALNSQYLLSADKLLPFNTPLTIYVANALIAQLDESEEKNVLVEIFGTTFEDIFAGKTEDEMKELFGKEIKSVVIENEPTPPVPKEETPLSVADSSQIALAITDSLTLAMDASFSNMLNQFKEFFTKAEEVKANKILEERIEAYKSDLNSYETLNKTVVDELKESLINQIILLKKVEKDSEYVTKLTSRSVQELKMTLEDHIQLVVDTPVIKQETPLAITDNLKDQPKTNVQQAIVTMDENDPASLEITDADKLLSSIVDKVESKLNQTQYSSLYKSTVFEHGSKIAKKLHSALKAQNKI